jgi:hypothetical protein
MALAVLPACSLIAGDFEIVSRPEEACAFSCNREFLLGCAGDEKVLLETCLTEAQCDSDRGLCTRCKAGETRCNGSMREVCSIDQTSWEPLMDCAPQVCNKTHCGACVPNEAQCAGAESRELLLCTQDGTYVSMGVCASAPLCERSVDRFRADMSQPLVCMEEACPAGTLGCLGETLRRCRTAGDGWDPIDTCLSAAVCELTVEQSSGELTPSCATGCSPAETFRCNGMLLEQCASNLTEWIPIEDCAASGLLCDSTAGACGGPCTPGSYRCNSAALEVCDASETWVLSAECATPALCVATQDLGGAWRAECLTPTCDPQMMRCNPDDPRLLERCNMDRTDYTLVETCASGALCRANDGRCDEPECMPGEGGVLPLQCDPVNPLVVQQCRADLTGFDPIQTCAEGEFCYPQDAADPCKTDCPAERLCNGSELWACTPEGTTLVADCATPTLCECVLNRNCAAVGANGCGVPVCGGVLPEYRCVDSFLQRCESGRNGWQQGIDCGSPELCRAGTAPEFEDGYCALCEITGEVRCVDDTTGHHTCGPDGKSWVQDTSCPQGCLERTGVSADYCAACAAGESRCEGTMPGTSRLRRCASDRASLDAGSTCPSGCIDEGLNDRCATCVAGEERCNGNTLTACNASRSALTAVMTCGQSCIDSGTNDYCGTCVPGSTQCDGDELQTCGNDGNWDDGDACTHACIPRDGNDVCAPECDPGTYSCSGAQLRVCNPEGEWDNHTLCASANHCDDDRGECDQCLAGEYSCNGTTLRSCDANGRWVAASSACNGTTLRTCPGGAVTTPTAQTCTLCDATNRECDDCSAQTPYSCSQGTLRQCDTTGHWNASNVPNCSGTTLRTCSGNTLSTRTCTATETCNETANACYECTPGTYSCDGTSLMVCDSTGHWTASVACVGSTERRCSSGSVVTDPCPGMQTCNAAGTECNQCNNGDTRCGTSAIQTCSMRKWTDTASCAPYMCVLSGGVATCGNCSANEPNRCDPADPLQPQGCMGGLWTDVGMACTGACANGDCVACVDAADCGPGMICSSNSCVQCTSTNTTACGAATPVCLNNTCVACMPPSARCSGAQPQTCSTAGAWTNNGMACSGDTPECVAGACQCTAGALRCNDDQPEICMSGTFMPSGDPCPADQVCMAGACVMP